jgi:HSP20 family protein
MASRNETQDRESRATSKQFAGEGSNGNQQQVQSRQSSQAQRGEEGRSLSRSQGRRDLTSGSSNPFESLWQLSREMDRLMGSVFGGGLSPLWGSPYRALQQGFGDTSAMQWSPRVEMEQRGDSIVVSADLPGVRKEDVQIELTQDGLTISAERRDEREAGDEESGYRSSERSFGSFYRTIPLPQTVDREQLKASMRDGVLRITIPLAESAKPRRIQIGS